jgi:hypothetical protein
MNRAKAGSAPYKPCSNKSPRSLPLRGLSILILWTSPLTSPGKQPEGEPAARSRAPDGVAPEVRRAGAPASGAL